MSFLRGALLCLAAFVLLASCGGSGNNDDETGSTSPTTPTSPIVGRWQAYFDYTDCKWIIEFRNDGTWESTSLDEWIWGTYTFTQNKDSDDILAITEANSNYQSSCLGWFSFREGEEYRLSLYRKGGELAGMNLTISGAGHIGMFFEKIELPDLALN